jgi:glutathione S-transferase
VPALKDGDLTIWDSLAICEYLAEKFPGLWPSDPAARAQARAAAAEMHSGFSSLRGECPMDLSAEPRVVELSEATHKDVRRIVALWNEMLSRHGGPFLAGEWSIADAFFTPVATRFRTYGVMLSDFGDAGAAGEYCERLLETPEFKAWEADAR